MQHKTHSQHRKECTLVNDNLKHVHLAILHNRLLHGLRLSAPNLLCELYVNSILPYPEMSIAKTLT